MSTPNLPSLDWLLILGLTCAFDITLSAQQPAGVHLVKDINAVPFNSDPAELIVSGGHLFFSAIDPVTAPGLVPSPGRELWKLEGDQLRRLTFINPDSLPTGVQRLTAVGGTVFVEASESDAAGELWESDGGAEGTM